MFVHTVIMVIEPHMKQGRQHKLISTIFLATSVTKKLDHNNARGWLNYYGIASMKNNIDDINGWLYHRIRMCIWKQWKKPRTKVRNLINMGVPKDLAMQAGNTRRGHWFATHTVAVNMAMTKERLINSGFYDLATAYQSVHVNY